MNLLMQLASPDNTIRRRAEASYRAAIAADVAMVRRMECTPYPTL